MQYCCHRSSINGSKLNHFLARAFGLMPKPILKPRPQVESYLFGRIKGGGRLADDFRVLGMPPGHMLLIGHLAGKGAGNYRHLEVGASFLYHHTRHANDGDSVCSTFHKVYSFVEWTILVFCFLPSPSLFLLSNIWELKYSILLLIIVNYVLLFNWNNIPPLLQEKNINYYYILISEAALKKILILSHNFYYFTIFKILKING